LDGEKLEERSSSGVKQEKFSEVPMGFLANAANVIVRNTTALITTQYYWGPSSFLTIIILTHKILYISNLLYYIITAKQIPVPVYTVFELLMMGGETA
jgi:hypothetical protein